MKRAMVKGKLQLHADEHIRRFDAEAWIIGCLGNPRHITAGKTTYSVRRWRIRAEILSRGLADTAVEADCRATFAQVYAKYYGASIHTPDHIQSTQSTF